MTARSEAVDHAHASVEQIVAWLDELVGERPAVRAAIEHCLRTLVLDARRRQVQAHIDGLDEKDLATVAALVTQLQRHPRDETS